MDFVSSVSVGIYFLILRDVRNEALLGLSGSGNVHVAAESVWCLHRRKIAPVFRRVLIAPRLLSAIPRTRLVSDAAMRKMLVSASRSGSGHLDDSVAEIDAGCVDSSVAIEKDSLKAYLWLPTSEDKKSYTVETPCLARFLSLVLLSRSPPAPTSCSRQSPPPTASLIPRFASFVTVRLQQSWLFISLLHGSTKPSPRPRRRGSLQPTPATCWTLLIPDSVVITCPKSHHGGHPHPSLQWDHSCRGRLTYPRSQCLL